MKLHEVAKELPGRDEDAPMVVKMLRKLLAADTPVFLVSMFEGKLTPKEIYDAGQDGVYSPSAPKDIAETPYTAVKHKAPGYYSWKTHSIGDGRGNGSMTIPHIKPEEYTIRRLPSVEGRVDYIFGTKAYVDQWEKQHEGK